MVGFVGAGVPVGPGAGVGEGPGLGVGEGSGFAVGGGVARTVGGGVFGAEVGGGLEAREEKKLRESEANERCNLRESPPITKTSTSNA